METKSASFTKSPFTARDLRDIIWKQELKEYPIYFPRVMSRWSESGVCSLQEGPLAAGTPFPVSWSIEQYVPVQSVTGGQGL